MRIEIPWFNKESQEIMGKQNVWRDYRHARIGFAITSCAVGVYTRQRETHRWYCSLHGWEEVPGGSGYHIFGICWPWKRLEVSRAGSIKALGLGEEVQS